MMEDKKFYEPKEEELEIDLMEYVRKIWAARKLLLKVAGIAAIVGIVVAFSIPKQYTVKVTLSPEASKMGRSSSLANMASMLGLGNAMNNEANALNLTMTEDIISSTPFVLELFDTRVQTIDVLHQHQQISKPLFTVFHRTAAQAESTMSARLCPPSTE